MGSETPASHDERINRAFYEYDDAVQERYYYGANNYPQSKKDAADKAVEICREELISAITAAATDER